MNKKTIGLSLLATFSLVLTTITVLFSKKKVIEKTEGATNYTLLLDASSLSGANGSGNKNVATNSGAIIQFDYTGLTISDGKLVFATSATLLNPRLNTANNNYISGIIEMKLIGSGDTASFTVDYTWGNSLVGSSPYYQRRGYVISKSFPSYSFLDERPNFFKLVATEESTVEAIQISYTCIRKTVEPSDNLEITSVSLMDRFRTVVNRGNSFVEQTVELKADIDLTGKSWTIGAKQSTPFKGTFEGNNFTISNYAYSASTSTAGLFAYCSGATIRNLGLTNFQVTLTSDRAAGLIGRSDGGTVVENVNLLSGNIAGTKENGGIVAVSAGNITISNCSNHATLNSLGNGGASNGGILGYAASGATNIINCKNFGTIYGSGDGTGGIIGTTATATSLILNVDGCENYGLISGSANVAGIGGLPRKSASTSKIQNSKNMGNVTASSSSAYVGGIVGRARVIIDNCGCLSSVIFTVNGVTTIASSSNMTGGKAVDPGYINTMTETGGEIKSNCYLLNESIGSFSSYQVMDKGPEFTNGRLIKLNDGRYFFTAVSGYSLANNFNEDAFINFKTRTDSYGWDCVPNEDKHVLSSNFCPLALPDGRIVIFYRTNPAKTNSNSSIYYSSIRALVSNDYGLTWTRHYLFENYSTEGSGAYEPFGIIDGDTIHVYFACDIQSTRAGGLGPNNSQFVETFDGAGMLYQNILRTTVDISNGGFIVGSTSFAIEATANYRRPGMPSIVKLNDGSYAMVFEHCGSISSFNNYAMVVAISYSNDLINWTAPKTIIRPNLSGDKNYGNLYRCGAPFVQLLPSGKIAVSYMTNEYYEGYECADVGGTDAWFRTQEIAVSSNIVNYNDTPSMTRLTNVRSYGENVASCYGACSVMDNKLIMISNNYSITGVGTRTKITGILFSVANLY